MTEAGSQAGICGSLARPLVTRLLLVVAVVASLVVIAPVSSAGSRGVTHLRTTTTAATVYNAGIKTSAATARNDVVAAYEAAVMVQPARGATDIIAPLPVTVVAADTAGDLAGAACGGESFTADTNVVMADGSTKPLALVPSRRQSDDEVRSTAGAYP